ncbi:MAG: class I SAM-dependent methyltransferase [Gemmatimonadota bacterium]|nr:class I SAM-dependent methyltransferase [Gemmatimonadota bacterium]
MRWITILVLPLTVMLPNNLSAQATRPAASQPVTAGDRWDQVFSRDMYVYGTEPVTFLKEQAARLKKGKVLCLAAGEGRNAVYLAQQGFHVTAMDASPRGLEKTRALARQKGVTVNTEVGDLQKSYDMGVAKYDLITDFYYHDTSIFPRVMKALKPGGMFILQNFSMDQTNTNTFGPKDPRHLVKPNELLTHFSGYRILYYEDTEVILDEGMHQGPGAVVRLIVVKEPM